MKPATTQQPTRSGDALRAANVRTGLILLSIALIGRSRAMVIGSLALGATGVAISAATLAGLV